jgi:hypothetical protein
MDGKGSLAGVRRRLVSLGDREPGSVSESAVPTFSTRAVVFGTQRGVWITHGKSRLAHYIITWTVGPPQSRGCPSVVVVISL